MNNIHQLETERLKLRQWCVADYPAFAKMNADPEVMQFYPYTLGPSDSHTLADKLKTLMIEQTWGFWAVELKKTRQFIGFVGLNRPTFDLPISPCTEIGWRLGKAYWGQGLATEAAEEVLKFAFEVLNLSEVFSFTSQVNIKSQRVMQRLSMDKMSENFDHPMLPREHALCEHVLYKITSKKWLENLSKTSSR